MINKNTNETIISPDLLFTGFYRIGNWWNYHDLTSPFYRLYLITSGECYITLNKCDKYVLHAGDMFLVPKYVIADYECPYRMEQFYVCLTDDAHPGKSVANPMLLKRKVEASPLDQILFNRLVEICPQSEVPSVDPANYDNDVTLWDKYLSRYEIQTNHEVKGIVTQLFSRFITEESIDNFNSQNELVTRIAATIDHINQNISKKIIVRDLAQMILVSKDHYSKSFKKVTGVSPIEYIQLRRITLAKELLHTTNLSIKEIANEVGFDYCSQFTKMFILKEGLSPTAYRSKLRHD